MNLIEQQARNRRRSLLVVAAFIGFLVFLGWGFDRFVLDARVPFPIGAAGALAFGSVSSLAAYFTGDKAVLLSSGAVAIDHALAKTAGDDQFKVKQFDNIVEEMAIASGLPKPRTYIVPDPDPNAFATGRDPGHASVVVTHGLLETLNRDELQAVVAHEMSHVRNFDIRLMTLVAALMGAVVLLADGAGRAMRFGSGSGSRKRSSKDSNPLGLVIFVVWIVAIVLAPFLAQFLAMAVSRNREYLADASAAELTRNPGALADALQKIEGITGPTTTIKRGSAHLCITDPLGRAVDEKEGFWADLFATHPPMRKRIEALRGMAYQSVDVPVPAGPATS